MQRIIGLLLWLLADLACADEVYLRLESRSYAEPTPIDSFLHNFEGRFQGGTVAFTHDWLELGARLGQWELGLLARYDYDLHFSRDMARLYHLASNKLPLTPGDRFDVELAARHRSSHGLRLGYHFQPVDPLRLRLGLAYLRGTKLTDGSLSGNASAVSDSDYDFNFNSDLYYSRDPLFEREVVAPKGWGYSLDLALDWQVTPRLELHLDVRDLWGEIHWTAAPHTVAAAGSDNKSFDEDGYVIFQPTLSGLEEYRDFTQRLRTFGTWGADYAIDDATALRYQAEFTHNTYFSGIGLAQRVTPGQRLSLLLYPQPKAIELDYAGPYWRVRLGTDQLRLDQANYWQLSAHLQLPF